LSDLSPRTRALEEQALQDPTARCSEDYVNDLLAESLKGSPDPREDALMLKLMSGRPIESLPTALDNDEAAILDARPRTPEDRIGLLVDYDTPPTPGRLEEWLAERRKVLTPDVSARLTRSPTTLSSPTFEAAVTAAHNEIQADMSTDSERLSQPNRVVVHCPWVSRHRYRKATITPIPINWAAPIATSELEEQATNDEPWHVEDLDNSVRYSPTTYNEWNPFRDRACDVTSVELIHQHISVASL